LREEKANENEESHRKQTLRFLRYLLSTVIGFCGLFSAARCEQSVSFFAPKLFTVSGGAKIVKNKGFFFSQRLRNL